MKAISRVLKFQWKDTLIQYSKLIFGVFAVCIGLSIYSIVMPNNAGVRINGTNVPVNNLSLFGIIFFTGLLFSTFIFFIVQAFTNIFRDFRFFTRLGITKSNAALGNLFYTVAEVLVFAVIFTSLGKLFTFDFFQGFSDGLDFFGEMSVWMLWKGFVFLSLTLITYFTFIALLIRVLGWKSIFVIIGFIVLVNGVPIVERYFDTFNPKALITILMFMISQIASYLVLTKLDDK